MPDKPRTCAHRAPATGRPACTRPAVYQVSRPSGGCIEALTCLTHLAAAVDALRQGDPVVALRFMYIEEGNSE